MKKRFLAILLIACMVLFATAQAQVDYALLDDMSLEELEALNGEVAARINALTVQAAEEAGILTLESAGGSITYAGFVMNDQNFKQSGSDTPVETIVIMFDYTNKEDAEKQLQSDFWIKAYQNGTEMDSPSSWSNTDTLPAEISNFYKSVLKGGTVSAARPFIPTDDSPITVTVNAQGSSSNKETGSMVLDFRNTPEGKPELQPQAAEPADEAETAEVESAEETGEPADTSTVDALLQGTWIHAASGGSFEFSDGKAVLNSDGSTLSGTYAIDTETSSVDVTLNASNGDVISHLPYTLENGELALYNNQGEQFEKQGEASAAPATQPASDLDPYQEFTDKDTVKRVQQALNDAGYNCGTPDGVAGKNTVNAVTGYQHDHALKETGTVTTELLYALGLGQIAEDAAKATKYQAVLQDIRVSHNSIGSPTVYVSVKNIGDTNDIVAFTFATRCKNAYGEVLKAHNFGDAVEYWIWQEGAIKPGKSTSVNENWFWTLYGFDTAYHIDVWLTEFRTSDGVNHTIDPEDYHVLSWDAR